MLSQIVGILGANESVALINCTILKLMPKILNITNDGLFVNNNGLSISLCCFIFIIFVVLRFVITFHVSTFIRLIILDSAKSSRTFILSEGTWQIKQLKNIKFAKIYPKI